MRLSQCHNFHDFRRLARRRRPGPIFNYIDGGADDETSQRKHVLSETIQSLQGAHRGDSRAHATCQTFASGSLRKP